jgi:hypothetical protein
LKDVDGNKHEGTQENVNIQWESPCNIQWGLQKGVVALLDLGIN